MLEMNNAPLPLSKNELRDNRISETQAEPIDLVIIGAGAAGLMAAIWAGRTNPAARVVVLESASTLGAKILISGGGRCNVTHHQVEASDYAGSSRNAIAKVLRHFDVAATISFFHELGVELKQEATGKLFPTTDSARTVLAALLEAARRAQVEIVHPWRVESVRKEEQHFVVSGVAGQIRARQIVLATGGKSLPKTGSDGSGYALAQALGHTLTPRIFPALVPLVVAEGHFIRSLSGLTLPTTLEVRSSTGKKLAAFTDSTLCTHLGLSGPAVLDVSRYYLAAKFDDANTALLINWWPQQTFETLDEQLQALRQTTLLTFLRAHLPERLLRALCAFAGVEARLTGDQLTREQRRTLARAITQMALPIVSDRGYNFAEVTAGGVPLHELHLNTMASRCCSGLFLCGEICDVDGRIGGFNFQWAWASGYTAGVAAVLA